MENVKGALQRTAICFHSINLQYVANDANAPHVRRKVDGVKPHHLRCHELRRAEHDPRLDARVVQAGQTEVDDLDSVTGPTETENVLRLCKRHSNIQTIIPSTDSVTMKYTKLNRFTMIIF